MIGANPLSNQGIHTIFYGYAVAELLTTIACIINKMNMKRVIAINLPQFHPFSEMMNGGGRDLRNGPM